MNGIDKDQERQIIALWKEALPDFRAINSYTFLRLNDIVATGVELGISRVTSRYKVRSFIHSFNHDDTETLYYDGYAEDWYSSGQHGFGPRYLGDPVPFDSFVDGLRAKAPLKPDLSLSDVIDFYETKSRIGQNSFPVIGANTLARFFLYGRGPALEFLETKHEVFESWNDQIQAMLGGSWDIWRKTVVATLSRASVDDKKRAFCSRGKRKNLPDASIIYS